MGERPYPHERAESLRRIGGLMSALRELETSVASGWEGEVGNVFRRQIRRLAEELDGVREIMRVSVGEQTSRCEMEADKNRFTDGGG